MVLRIIHLVLFFLSLQYGFSQENTGASNPAPQQDEYGIFDTFSGNPGKAALYSLIFPGAGQFYNKRYWKVPIALAAEGAAIYILAENIREFRKWDDEWKYQLQYGMNNEEVTLINDAATVKLIRDNARQRKDYSWVGLIGVHILITAEAFIDRHLIEFDVSEDLSMHVLPMPHIGGVQLVFNF